MGAENGAAAQHTTGSVSVWWTRLESALRTAIACIIVGCMALYGPQPIRHQLRYPSVSYMTAILILSDATLLGHSVRGCLQALCAAMLVWPPSVFCLWVIGPARFSEAGAALAVALSAFFVSLPESLPLLVKRIAFVQLVIIYVGTVIHGPNTGSIAHPNHVAANTTLGALASVLALLIPYPWLAISEVKKLFQLYTENASLRTSLYMKAFFSEDKATADELISQAKPFAETGAKLLHQIKLAQDGIKWERPWTRGFKYKFVNKADGLDEIETPIKGMEMALAAIPLFPNSILNDELRSALQSSMKLEQAKCFAPSDDDATAVPEKKGNFFDKSLNSLATISPTQEDLPAFFFLSCIELLLNGSSTTQKPESVDCNSQKDNVGEESRKSFGFRSSNFTPSNKRRLIFALKCSLSLGLAVFLGLTFNKQQGYWSGLTIAISFVTGRQPTFTVANARIQGTAIGSVYGVIGGFLLQRVPETRFVILLPWIIFTSLIRHSRMYGEAGGISAVIGALLILGRENFGPRNVFAITRLTEASIGLLSLILVELLLQPVRAATLVKNQLSRCLATLEECIQQIALCSGGQKENGSSAILPLTESHRKLKSHVDELKKLSKIAESEPNFWFLPYRSSCHDKLQESLSRMIDLLQIMVYSLDFLLQASQRSGIAWTELQQHMNRDLLWLTENTSPSIKRLEKITLIKSLDYFEQQLKDGRIFQDVESGNPETSNVMGVTAETTTKVLDAFLQHSKEVTDKIQATEGEEEKFKGKTILHLNSLGFCISSILTETKQLEKGVKEMIQWENPSRLVDFHELCCKIDIVYPQKDLENHHSLTRNKCLP